MSLETQKIKVKKITERLSPPQNIFRLTKVRVYGFEAEVHFWGADNAEVYVRANFHCPKVPATPEIT